MSRFVGLFVIINKYSAVLNPDMHCSHSILKHSDYCFIDESIAYLNFNYTWLNKKNRDCYRKYLLDPGIQVWSYMVDTGGDMVDVKEALLTQISGASYPNDELPHPYFLPCRHGWNFCGSSVSIDLPYSSILRFTPFDPTSSIIVVVYYSSSKVFWETTLIFWASGGGGGTSQRISRCRVSLPTPSLGLRWWQRLDFDISIDSTLSNHFLRHARGSQPGGIRFSCVQ